MKPVYIIGHKNPDLDSVAAAIAYQSFKEQSEPGHYQAAIAGEISGEVVFALDVFGFAQPPLVKSVATKVEDLLDDQELLHVHPESSLEDLSRVMRSRKVKTVPVLDDAQKLLGLLTIGDVAQIFMENLGDMVNVVDSPAILARILKQPVSGIMKSSALILFEADDGVEEARQQMLRTRYRNYPVIDEHNTYLGMISRYNLLQMKRKKVILVDHNERQQAVDGIEEAEIIEVIDHHRVGDLQTISPIYFHNEPVGSTSTLIAEKFIMRNVPLDKALAGLLLSGILSDTLIFRSPTTSVKDIRIAESLQVISGLDPGEWGKKIFAQAMPCEGMDDQDLISSDLKEYSSGDRIFAISQIETIDLSSLEGRKSSLTDAMQQICQERGYVFMVLMLTDILEEASVLLIAGRERALAEEAFGASASHGGTLLKGILSRKKQVLPAIYEIIRKKEILG